MGYFQAYMLWGGCQAAGTLCAQTAGLEPAASALQCPMCYTKHITHTKPHSTLTLTPTRQHTHDTRRQNTYTIHDRHKHAHDTRQNTHTTDTHALTHCSTAPSKRANPGRGRKRSSGGNEYPKPMSNRCAGGPTGRRPTNRQANRPLERRAHCMCCQRPPGRLAPALRGLTLPRRGAALRCRDA